MSEAIKHIISAFDDLNLDQKREFADYMVNNHESLRRIVANEQFLKESQAMAKIGSWEWDIPKDKITWSDELYHMFGEHPETFESNFENYMSLIHPDDVERVQQTVQKAMQDFQPYFMTHKIKRRDGEVRIIVSKGSVKTEDGKPIRFFGTAQDITEQHHQEQKFRSLLESAPDAMIIANNKGEIILANLQTKKLFGYKRGELVGEKVEVLIPNRFREKHKGNRKKFNHKPNTRPMGQGLELFGVKKDGTEFPVEISLSPITNRKEMLVAAAIRDISSRKEAERKKKELYEKIEASNKELESFAYIVSHDLKAPIRSISTVAEWIQEDLQEKGIETDSKNWEILQQQTTKMYQLIDGILEYSRIGRVKEDFVELDFKQVVESIFSMYPDRKNIVFEVENNLPKMQLESTRINQVFQNLISNAVRAIGENEGKIAVSCTEDDSFYTLSVQDNGPGIDPKHFERIFIIFQSLSKSAKGNGTGIGLTIVKKIIENYGGKIWLESSPGKGATFYFTLPKSIQNKE